MNAHYNDIQGALDECGGECWTVNDPGEQVIEMYRSPDGRGAICHGGDSVWGEWVTTGRDGQALLMLDDPADDGSAIYYTESGEQVQ